MVHRPPASPITPEAGPPTEAAGGGRDDSTEPDDRVTVYWRPGCVFCASLRRQLRRAGIETVERDIWADPEAAAFVRLHARGNETVPTVDVAGTVLVNPTVRQVRAAAGAGGLPLPEPPPPWWRRGKPGGTG